MEFSGFSYRRWYLLLFSISVTHELGVTHGPDCHRIRCLTLRKISRSVLNVHLLLIINLSLKLSLFLPVLSLSATLLPTLFFQSLFFFFFSASLLNACNYCVSRFLVHHLTPHRWHPETSTVQFVPTCSLPFAVVARRLSLLPLSRPSGRHYWSATASFRSRMRSDTPETSSELHLNGAREMFWLWTNALFGNRC